MAVQPQQIVIYTTQFCPYCVRAKALLSHKGVEFKEIRVDSDRQLREEMMRLSKQTTVPQIWIGEKHIGGCDDLYLLEREGKLDLLLNNNK